MMKKHLPSPLRFCSYFDLSLVERVCLILLPCCSELMFPFTLQGDEGKMGFPGERGKKVE